jgi:hypothetical protein
MSVGRISGPLLKDNLLRNGANLAFETNLLYLDVVNSRIGVSNSNPAYQLDVTGTTRTTDLRSTTATVNEVYISTNIVSSTFGNLNLTANSGQSIVVGTVGQNNDVLINGSLHATGGFTVDGNTIVGTNGTNTVAFNSSVSTSFIPNDSTHDLGSSTKVWANIYSNSLHTTSLASGNIQISGNTILATNTDGVITLTPNGVGNVNVNSTLASTAYNNGSLVVGGGVGIAGAIFANSTLSVAGHVTLEGVTSTGATGTGKLVFATSPSISDPTVTGHITVEGVTSTGATGTGKIVFATSPTFSGHITVEGVTATGATGTGKFVFDTSPTISGATLTNHVTVEGVTSTGATGTGKIVFDTSPTISAATLTNHVTVEGVTSTGATGTNKFVFDTSPTISAATLTNHVTVEGITSTGATGTGKFVFDNNPTISGHPTVEGVTSTGATGTGNFVFSASPTLTGTLAAASGTFSGTLGVTGDFAVNTNKFTVAASTGNTAVAGTLNVTGLSTLATAKVSNLTSGRVVLAGTTGTIQDSGNLTFDGTLLTVTGNQKITGNLGVDGNITLGGNIQIGDNVVDTVTVTADFTSDLIPQVTNTYNLGSTTYRWKSLNANTLDVSGASTLSGNTTVGGTLGVTNDFSVNTNKFTVAASTGNTLVAGTLNVTGHTTFEGVTSTGATGTGNLVYSASPTFSGTLTAANITDSGLTAGRVTFAGLAGALTDSANLTFSSGTLTVGTSIIAGGVTIGSSDITLTGGNITGVLGITATGTISAAVIKDSGLTSGRLTYATTNGQLTDSSNLTFDGTQLTTNALSVTNNALVGGTLGVTSSFSVNTNKFTVASATGNTAVAGTLNVTGHVTLEGVTSTGATGINKLVFDTNPTISGATFTNHVTVEGVTSAGATGTGKLVFDNTPTIVTPTISGHFTAEGVTTTGATGTGKLVFDNTPTIVTPTISGHFTAEGVTTTGATGTGKLVFDGSPTLVTPTLGVASATTINKVTITSPATGSTLTIADGKTLTASNTLTFTGTDGSSVAFSSGGTVTYTSNKLSVFSATTSAELAGVLSDETGFSTGALAVFSKSPSIDAPTITGHPVVEGVTSTGATGTGNFVFSASPTFTGTVTLPAITATNITNSALTSGRVVYSTTAGLETDSANLTFNGTTLTANALAVTAGATVGTTLDVTGLSTLATAKVSNLTSGRVVLAGASGTIQDSGNLTFNGTKLTVTGDQDITGNLKVDGNISLGGNITIGDNVLDTVTVTADFTSDLIPQATNTYNLGSSSYRWKKLFANALDVSGTTVLGNLQLSGNTLQATNTDGGVTLTANGTGYVSVSGSGAFLIPAGNTAARPGTPAVGMIRYNNQLTQFEGYSSGNWSSLGGVRSVDGNAYIIAETSPGAADDTLHFWAGAITSTNVGNWTDTALTILSPGFRVPTGDTAHRPTGVDGYIRFNTQINKFEGYSNSNWSSLGGVSSVNGTTYIGAEAYPGAGDNTLYFYANGILQLTIDPTKADFKNLVNVSDTTNSVSTITGSITTAGGVGIAKNLYVGLNANIAGTLTASSDVTFNGANAAISLAPTGTGTITVNPTVLGSINNMSVGATTASTGRFTTLTATTSATFSPSGTVTINPTTQSTMDNVSIGSTTRAPGAFTTLASNGLTTFTDTTASTSSSSGALVVTGGTGVGGNLYVGGNINSTGTITAGSTLTANAAVNLNPANFNISIAPTGTGTATINPATTGTINNMSIGATTKASGAFTTLTSNNATTFTANTASTNTTSGTVVVTGGVGISGAVNIGGAIGAGAATFTSVTDSGLTAGRVTFAGTGGLLTDDSALTYSSGTLTAGTSLVVSGTAGDITMTDGNITGVLGITASGTVQALSLKATNLTSGRVTYAGTSGVLQDSANLTFNGTTLTVNAFAVTNDATVGGTLGVTGATTLSSTLGVTGITSITNATESSSTTTGALKVSGGVGIVKNLYVGGNSNIAGTETVTGTFTANGAVSLSPANYSVTISPTGSGSVTINPNTLGAIDNTAIGANTRASGAFTSLASNGNATFSGNGSIVSLTPSGVGYVTINPTGVGAIDNMVIGANTAKAGTFTALTATTSASLSPTGTVTINPSTLSSVDNVNIGATTAGTGKFTTLQATTSANFSPSGTVTINPTTVSSIDNVIIGATTAKAATFTSVTDTGLTSGRVTFAGTNGLLSDNSGFTFNNGTTTLTVTNASVGALTATTSASLSPSGTVTINPTTVSNADNIVIGANTAKAGTFTDLTVNTSASFSPSGTVTINPTVAGTINNMSIGATTKASGAFTTLTSNNTTTFTSSTDSTNTTSGAVQVTGGVGIAKNLYVGGNLDITGTTTAGSTFTASAAVNLNPSNYSVSIAPTGTGTATINPATVGAIDNMIIGANTPKGATFTTLTTQGNVTLNGSDSVISLTPTGSGYVAINPGALGTINNMSVGATTASTGKFTTLQATTSATFDTSGNVSIQPAGTVTINPTTTSSVDNVNIGANTRGSGAFTTLTSNDTVTFTSSTESTSTTTGALKVSGGVGIVKNLYVGGNTSIAGNLTVLGTTTSIQSTVTTLTDPVIAVGGLTDTGLVDAANRGVQTRYATDISSQVTSWTGDYSSSVVANLSVTAASLGFKIGDKINISGSGLANLDGVGTVTSVDSTTVTFTAPGAVATGTSANIATVGLSKNGFFGYEPTSKKFVYIPDAIISSNVVTGNYGDAEFNSLTLISALAVPQGGTGTTSFTTKGIVYGNGSSGLQVTAASDMGGANATTSYGILTTDSSNTPVWTDVIDCGTY